jgi:hypothetical protein
MSRSSNTSRGRNFWNPDHKAHRARKGAETKSARKNERREIRDSMNGRDCYDHQESNTGFYL